MYRITCAAFAGLLGLWGFSNAAQAEGITGEVGAGVSYQPHDPTGSRYETRPIPYFDLDWGSVSLGSDDGLTWSALNTTFESIFKAIKRLNKALTEGSSPTFP